MWIVLYFVMSSVRVLHDHLRHNCAFVKGLVDHVIISWDPYFIEIFAIHETLLWLCAQRDVISITHRFGCASMVVVLFFGSI
ncbi:hypothetical protein PVK06_003345 [Gossypium arboreum]|uniref:Secreted protein n=1 Tax=Gossypium arboreum TaxID=29729 RepID=A0ABR0R7H1_GOSAR|nr:hypothetical protein PVK06_003345 [Gossypium arboreum]